ncbi:hypothetical protein ACWEOZ_12270 [Actinoplanes sp. NPDC004185]
MIDWSATESVVIDDRGGVIPVSELPSDQAIRASQAHSAVRICPGSSPQHRLPDDYGSFGEPIVLGVVGNSLAGKTHLLAAMVGQMLNVDRMDILGLEVRPLDQGLHQRFQADFVDPLLTGRRQLDATPIGRPNALTYAAEIHSRHSGRSHALAFFDVSGEQFLSGQGNDFIQAVTSLIFVVDATNVPPLVTGRREVPPDGTFEVVLQRLELQYRTDAGRGGGFVPLPAALVVSKADHLTFDPDQPIRRWFAGPDDDLDLTTVDQESEDVYAFLATRGAGAWLSPVQRLLDVSLHYASATNCDPVDNVFPARRFRQRRVFKPLLTLLHKQNIALSEVA